MLLQDKVSQDLPDYSLGMDAFNELRKWANTSAEEYALLHAKRDAAAGCPALGLRFAFHRRPQCACSRTRSGRQFVSLGSETAGSSNAIPWGGTTYMLFYVS